MHILRNLLFVLNIAFIRGLVFPTTTITPTTTPCNKVHNSDIMTLNQILRQETVLRVKLEETVRQLMAEFENMKKQQSAWDIQISTLIQAKADQDVLNRQLQENITSVRVENENLKQELFTIKNSSFFTSGLHSCDCNIKNVTQELTDFKTSFRYMTLSLLDIQQKTDEMQDRIDDQSRNLTKQDAAILTTAENLERIRPKVEKVRNETSDLKSDLLKIQHKQNEVETDILRLKTNVTKFSEKVAFTATVTQDMTSQSGQTLVFPHIITNVGGGYNGNTGVFTAQRDGVYVFFCKITGRDNSGDIRFEFILNGSAKTHNLVYGRSTHPYRTSSNSIVLQLTHGDRVWIKMSEGGKHYNYGAGGDQSFSGYLL
uniref:Uncharacterized protein LOC111102222 n=1 Tax=Crassostrea virginica TaxID=6565 RepID=A0A8B8AGF6_CRAVI|nr:uncharacterized protein LOC111102222 [Crassostrea virginica]